MLSFVFHLEFGSCFVMILNKGINSFHSRIEEALFLPEFADHELFLFGLKLGVPVENLKFFQYYFVLLLDLFVVIFSLGKELVLIFLPGNAPC